MPTTTTATRAARLLVLLAALGTLLFAGAPQAAAHASLTGSSPADGEVVATAPDTVVLTFSERVTLSGDKALRVLDPAGGRVDTGEITDLSADGTVRHGVALAGGLADGTYTVAWQAISADSHPIAGAFTFSVGAPSETSVRLSDQQPGGGTVGLLYETARFPAYAGFVLLVGGVAFTLLCRPGAGAARAGGRLALAGWTALTGATLALVLLRGPYTGVGLRDAIDTKTGTALLSRLLLLAAAALFLAVLYGGGARERRGGRGLPGYVLPVAGTLLAVGLAATWALSEHASTGHWSQVAVPADVIHLLAAGAWLGGLATLLTLLFRFPEQVSRAVVRRFSLLAFWSVVALAVTGIFQAWRQVGDADALLSTRYGQLLIVKVALVVLILAAAWISRRWTARLAEGTGHPDAAAPADHEDRAPEPATVPSAPGDDSDEDPVRRAQLARQRAAVRQTRRRRDRDADAERSGLRRSVLAEAAIAALILAVTTALTGSTPARTEAAAATASTPEPISVQLPYDTGGPHGQGTALLDITPGGTGDNVLHLRLTDPEGLPNGAEEVRISLTLPAEDLGPLRYEPTHVDVGHWVSDDLRLPRPGDWELSLTLRTSEIDQTTETTTVTVG
ncbi:copper resistance CopC/CopD family protein [Streptomyces xiamenensis]|uniref:copper resistance CopC/CopD family protein n=1 Tax=Streptomyces xiamenensis TaxID=408015 RepID=UPI0037D8CC91